MWNQRTLRIVVPAFLVVCAVLIAGSRAQPPNSLPGRPEGVMLLKNGRILQGEITFDGQRYSVSVPGGRISVKASDVELCCRSLEEIYRHRQARMSLANARDCVELARWCQQHGLLEHAAEELDRAEAIEPDHPLIPILRRGLELAETVPTLPQPQGELRGRDFSTAELDKMVREMPPGTVESFAQTVQPLLLNNCSAADCHGPGSETAFRLLRASAGRPPSRRLTQRNLRAVLDQIDRENAVGSRLLTVPIHAHGPAEGPVFDERNAPQYQQLVDWVFRVAQADASPKAPPHLDLQKPSSETVPAVYLDSVAAGADEPEKPAETQTSWAEEIRGLNLGGGITSATPDDPSFPAPGLVPPRPTVQRGADLPVFVPKDPFDPEIFNRRFHEGRESSEDRTILRKSPAGSGSGP